jgi:hypothetical protein
VLLRAGDIAFVAASDFGEAHIAYITVFDDDPGDRPCGGYIAPAVDPDPAGLGEVLSMIPADDDVIEVFASTRDTQDGGVIVRFNTQGSFNTELVVGPVDPANPRTHASSIVSDGFFLYYATAGVLQPGNTRGVFRYDLFADTGLPERLADLAEDAGPLVVLDGVLYFTVPAEGALYRFAP